jgi:hypothetical protein
MNITINPFQQLYFSDDTQTDTTFAELFSAEVLQTAINPVFQGGNVVLSGSQGCGKTMILTLLRPETRIAYAKLGIEFPVDRKMRNFVSAGVNLTRSRITDIVQVTMHGDEATDDRELPRFFADFFNYWVIEDLIKSIERIGKDPEVFDSIVNLANIDKFVRLVSNQDCWNGALRGIDSLNDMRFRFAERINEYRRWVNGNLPDDRMPDAISKTKTDIGEPIARVAEDLRKSGVISEEVPVLIRVDQIEEMHRAFNDRQRKLLLSFRKMLNRAFAARDARIHYRIGTRRYGWRNPEFLTILGSDAQLENRRDYQLIDMDAELFAQGETTKSRVFEKFTDDAFQKRVQYYFRSEISKFKPHLVKAVFGKSPTPAERISNIIVKQDDEKIDGVLGLDHAADGGQWTSEWRTFLRGIYRTGHEGMLDAVLAAAWGRQTGGARSKRQHRESPPPKDAPWRERKWWRKERLDQAVLQLTTRSQQRFMWWGYKDISSLSGGNITVFLHICHRIWDGFLKNESSLPEQKRTDILNGGTIDNKIQAAGILFASNEWFNKLPEEPGGNARKSFVEKLGTQLNEGLLRDLSMSYPGGNGVSIALSEYESEASDVTKMRNFIREAGGYGVLYETEHSSKSKAGGRRIKLYLNPILCPRFQLPEARTKEPCYLRMSELFDLAKSAQITLSGAQVPRSAPDENLPLFPDFKEPKS